MAQKLAIIGGGPKGAAIAAKAAALRQAKFPAPAITVYEHDALGAAWSGYSGYTDGLQPLCTLAERDLGYPYDRQTFGPAVAHLMLAEFSWHAFAVRYGVGPAEYGEWVLRGRSPPAHRDFAKYVAMAIANSGALHVPKRVVALDYDKVQTQWRVTSEDPAGNRKDDPFDGVIVTGSGKPHPPLPGSNGRVFDGKSFWSNIPAIRQILDNDLEPSVVIIGAGGTGAAIAHWFIRERIPDTPITIIGREPTLYARHPGYFEDRLFTDSIAWNRLADHAKDAFVARLTSGVVWDYVLRNLVSDDITYECYDVRQFQAAPAPTVAGLPPELRADLFHPPDPTQSPAILGGVAAAVAPTTPVSSFAAAVFIDARGFDPLWFVDDLLLNSWLHPSLAAKNRRVIMADVDDSLAIGGSFPKGLHIPMLATRRGPAASNLMGLGWMSDQILRPYVTPAPVLSAPSIGSPSPP